MMIPKRYNWFLIFVAFCLAIVSYAELEHANPEFGNAFSKNNGQQLPQQEQPYILHKSRDNYATLVLDIHYLLGQNTAFIVEPLMITNWKPTGCIETVTLLPAGSNTPEIVKENELCKAASLDLSPYLKEGRNQLVFNVRIDDDNMLFNFNPQLFGSNFYSTLACTGLFAAAVVLLIAILSLLQLDWRIQAIACIGLFFFTMMLHTRNNTDFVEDIPWHMEYVLAMGRNITFMKTDMGQESYQPPLYYLLAGRIDHALNNSCALSAFMGVRIFSVFLYMVFCVFGVLTLRASVPPGMSYYASALLIMLWPLGIGVASNISNDSLLYGLWSAAFYYLVQWCKCGRHGYLRITLLLCAIALTVKSNAWLIIAITGSCILSKLLSRHMTFRQLLTPKNILAASAIIVGMTVNLSKLLFIYLPDGANPLDAYFGGVTRGVFPLAHFTHIDWSEFIAHPFLRWNEEPSYLNFFLKSMLFGVTHWDKQHGMLWVPAALYCIMFTMLALTIAGTILIVLRRRNLNELSPHLFAIAISFVASLVFSYVEGNIYSQNFRYVLPSLIPLIILYGKSLETFKLMPRCHALYWVGITIAAPFTLGSIYFFISLWQ